MKDKEISKYLSLILRHKPEHIGLILSAEGWCNLDTLIEKSKTTQEIILDRETIKLIVKNSDKKRFQISDDGLNIRAVQGHSTDTVNRAFQRLIPPLYLYHGTSQRFISSIQEQGLIPKDRQYVHLTENKETALSVGKRYGKPTLLVIDALQMHNNGFEFFQAENNVWFVKHVPVKYINRDIHFIE